MDNIPIKMFHYEKCGINPRDFPMASDIQITEVTEKRVMIQSVLLNCIELHSVANY